MSAGVNDDLKLTKRKIEQRIAAVPNYILDATSPICRLRP